MPLIHVLWYLDKYLLGSGYSDAVVVVDDTPAMAAKIAMSDLRTKVAFLAVSTIKQKDLGIAVGGALQHAIIMRYMLEADQTEQGATAAPWDTQEEWLQRGIPLWVLDSVKRKHPKGCLACLQISRPQSLVSASTQNFQTSHFESPAVPF